MIDIQPIDSDVYIYRVLGQYVSIFYRVIADT